MLNVACISNNTKKKRKKFTPNNEYTNAVTLLSYPTWTTCGTRSPGLLRGNNNAKESSRRQIKHLRELGSTGSARGGFDKAAGGVTIATTCDDPDATAGEVAAGAIEEDESDNEDDMGSEEEGVSIEAGAATEEEKDEEEEVEEEALGLLNGGFGAFAI